MSDAVVIRLTNRPTQQPEAQWLLVDAAGGRLGIVMSGSLADAAPMTVGRKVIVLVPGTAVHLAKVKLPAKRGAQADQLLRYALEEQLATDVDDLHFAKGKRELDGATPVAAVASEAMAAWIAAIHTAGIAPDFICSEADLLPHGAGHATLIVDGPLLFVQQGTTSGNVLDIQPLDVALQLALPADGAGSDVLAYVAQAEYEQHAATLAAFGTRIANLQTKLLPEGVLPLLALQAAQGQGVNLLSGPYARKKSWHSQLAPWRIAAALAGAALLLHVVGSAVRFWGLTRAEKSVDQAIHELVTQTIPNAQVGDTSRARQLFESQLSNVRGGQAGGLLASLHTLAGVLEQVPDTRIDNIVFRSNTIDLRVTAPNVDALARIQQLAKEEGLQTELQSTTPRDNKAEGRLQLKLAGA